MVASPVTSPVEPSVDRIEQDINDLARIRDPQAPGWAREVFSDAYRQSRDWVAKLMRDAGLDVHVDGAGNIVGVLHGRQPGAPAIVTGSHTDTVIGGGRFDGVVGVLGAVELARQIRGRGGLCSATS